MLGLPFETHLISLYSVEFKRMKAGIIEIDKIHMVTDSVDAELMFFMVCFCRSRDYILKIKGRLLRTEMRSFFTR